MPMRGHWGSCRFHEPIFLWDFNRHFGSCSSNLESLFIRRENHNADALWRTKRSCEIET